ncbi:MAG: SDR family oxidoreductase [Desulfamplus sp.]|nr:SDR family oxidoreductase [Desulfamplus sp.]
MNSQHTAIAIVGLGLLYPGSDEKQTFWKNIIDRKDLFSEIPENHWLIQDYYAKKANDKESPSTYARRGGFISDTRFDPMEFGIPPKVLPSTDVVQLLSLIVAKKVLEDAHSIQFNKIDRDKISVILGAASTTGLAGQMASKIQKPVWQKILRESGLPESQVQDICTKIYQSYVDWDENTFPGLLNNVVAGRIANRFDCRGTNCTVDAACASSFAAIEMAILELMHEDSDVVITGGVDASNDIFSFLCFTRTPTFSLTEDCRPFSKDADGTMLGEGVGMVALRRLADAEKDGDTIYAIIRSIGSSSDGKSKSVYAPNPEGQMRAIIKAYSKLDFGFNEVELIEGHGTATFAGDIAEFEGLKTAMHHYQITEGQHCALGSIKSQIGHAKAAAGAASLIKTVMALYHKVLPPTIKVSGPNPNFEIEHSPFYINTYARPWIHPPATTRKAGINSFGFGGSNFHIVVEEYKGSGHQPKKFLQSPLWLFLFSADTEISLLSTIDIISRELQKKSFEVVAFDTQNCFNHSDDKRLAIIAHSSDEFIRIVCSIKEKIKAQPNTPISMPGKAYYRSGAKTGKIAFLFPGQGSQYVDMAIDLVLNFDVVRNIWDSATLPDVPGKKLHQVVYPIPVFNDTDRNKNSEMLTRTEWAQPAIGTVSIAIASLLNSLGVNADCVSGHSCGEIAALYHAGFISSFNDFIEILKKRGELMAEKAEVDGAMSAVFSSYQTVNEIIQETELDVCIANINSPSQIVVSGETCSISAVEKEFQERNIVFRRLPVSTAFHSKILDPCVTPFDAFLKTVHCRMPSIPVFSNATGLVFPSNCDDIKKQLAAQLSLPVHFQQEIENMYQDGVRIFIETGPGTTLSKLIEDCLKHKQITVISTDKKGQHGLTSLLNALALLSVSGVDVSYQKFWDEFEKPINNIKKLSPTSITINGANFQKIYPPTGGAAALPKPNPEPILNKETSLNKEASVDFFQVSKTENQNGNNTELIPSLSPMEERNVIDDFQNPIQTSIPESLDHDTVNLLFEIQEKTFNAQRMYLETVAESHSRYMQSSEEAFKQLASLDSGTAFHSSTTSKTHNYSENQDISSGPSISALTGYGGRFDTPMHGNNISVSTVAPPSLEVDRQFPSIPTQNIDIHINESAIEEKNHSDQIDINKVLMEIVSEKTGYPKEMLGLNMSLESELGIDSIKRVEILSAVKSQVPDTGNIDMSKLATLNTIAEIVGFVEENIKGFSKDFRELSAEEEISAEEEVSGAAACENRIDFKETLLEIVSEKTGYPKEMLGLNMSLESELGIDSIKRVEILSEVKSYLPDGVELDMNNLATLNTIDEIFLFVEQNLDGSGETKPEKCVVDEPNTAIIPIDRIQSNNLGRYIPQMVEAPRSGASSANLLQAQPLFIVIDNRGIYPHLASLVESVGISVKTVEQVPDDADSVIYLKGLDEHSRDILEKQLEISRHAFITAKICGKNIIGKNEKTGFFITVQDTGGNFGLKGESAPGIWSASLPGLVKTALQEWKNAYVKSIDIDCSQKNEIEIANQIFNEIIYGGDEHEVGITALNVRQTFELVQVSDEEAAFDLSENDVLIVSGGGRGVTAACVLELMRHKKLNIAIFGRTKLEKETARLNRVQHEKDLTKAVFEYYQGLNQTKTPLEISREVHKIMANREIESNLNQFRAYGDVLYFDVDITRFDALNKAIKRVRQKWGKISGIIHAAGILADKLIHEKTVDQFQRVFNTKVVGLYNLLKATEHESITHLCCFSSVAARFGNSGQSDYAMANEVLNKVCWQIYHKKQGRCLVKSINWGPWEGGMVTPSLKVLFESKKIPLIPLKQGAQQFVKEFTHTGDAVEILIGCSLNPTD